MPLTTVKSFTTKNNGDTIQAAHVNDAQDEIVLTEQALLNANASLNLGASTVASLGVTGASTLSGAVTLGAGVASTVSFASSATFSAGVTHAVRPVAPPPDFLLAYLESTRTLGSSAQSTIAWNHQAIAINSSIHSTTTNPERLIPQSTGLYRVSAQLTFGAGTTAKRVRILDSTGDIICEQVLPGGVTSNEAQIQASGYKRYDAVGGYAVCVAVSTAAPSTLSLSTGVGVSWFALQKL